MSDLVKGFVLGQMSEGYFKDMERTATSLFRPRLASQRTATIDANEVLQAARELSEYVESQKRYVADLERDHFARSQSGRVGERERRLVLEIVAGGNQSRDLLAAEHHRQGARNTHRLHPGHQL